MKDSNTTSDSDYSNEDGDGSMSSSVGKTHFIHATPYHKNGLYELIKETYNLIF